MHQHGGCAGTMHARSACNDGMVASTTVLVHFPLNRYGMASPVSSHRSRSQRANGHVPGRESPGVTNDYDPTSNAKERHDSEKVKAVTFE